jgi:mercuric ion binding protein
MSITKTFLAISFFALLFASCKETASEPKAEMISSTPKKITAIAKLETASFNVEGMTCAFGCAKSIEKELTGLEGVQKATVDFDTKTATIAFDAEKQNPASLMKTIKSTGDGKTYTVSTIKL